ncbi:MAG: TerB family tellurite resistance protein [Gammaproteobacteria bacterium]|nr:TerB family tellurite resistance protein [Gammaproteobacteria bacterium]
MLAAIKNFFEAHILIEEGESADREDHALKVATAALLLEMSRADFDVKDEELLAVAQSIQSMFQLNEEDTRKLVMLAEQESAEATCYYEFTSLINKGFDMQQKIKIVELMWHVAYADKQLEKYEEALVRKLTELLYVPHAEYIAAKHRVQSTLGMVV